MVNIVQLQARPAKSVVLPCAPRSLELFAGGGGMALGLHMAGFHHTSLVEFEPKACDTLIQNAIRWKSIAYNPAPWLPENIQTVDVRDFDPISISAHAPIELIAGGPPCQPFSLGGTHAGMKDTRNMFPAALDIVREIRPKVVLFENVAGLLRPSFRPYFEYVEAQLRNIALPPLPDETWVEHRSRLHKASKTSCQNSYLVTRQLVNAADFGIPQVRKRVLLMAVRSDVCSTPIAPLASTHSEQALIYDQHGSGEYWLRHNINPPLECIQADIAIQYKTSPLSSLLPWRTVRDAIADLPEPREGKPHKYILNHVGIPGARSYPGHTGSDIDKPSKTIKAGVHGVCGGEAMIRYPSGRLRYMSVREAARIQSFPDDYEFIGARSHAMRHIGNAVPVKLAEFVGRHIRSFVDL